MEFISTRTNELPSNKHRVVYNTYPVAFDVVGGGEVQLLSYLREIPQLGFNSALFDPWHPCLELFDIVHFFSAMPGSLPFCEYISQKKIPLFVSPNMWLDDAIVESINLEPIKAQLDVADQIICNSQMELDNFSRILHLPREKFTTVYCGIDDVFLLPPDLSIFRKKNKSLSKFVLNVGTVERRKNQLNLIRAMKAFPDYTLVLIGNMRDLTYAEECFSEGGSQLVYLGPLLRDEPLLRSAMAACDLFVGPGLMETPGGANLEAAAQGAPLVVTEAGSTREYFRDMVVYFNPTDEKSLEEAIATALRKKKNDNLRPYICKNFQWRRVLRPLADSYTQFLKASMP